MATHNIFHAGEGGVANAFGSNAWAMYPRPDIVCNKEYKGPGQYSGAVTRRIAGTATRYVSDGGLDPLIRYLRGATVVNGDELAMIVIPAHWRINSITAQVYNADEMSGVYEGGATGAATGATGVMSLLLRQPACTALGLTAADQVLAATVNLNTSAYNSYTATAATSVGNRLIVAGLTTVPTDWTKVNFEVTVMMEKVRDIGRPT